LALLWFQKTIVCMSREQQGRLRFLLYVDDILLVANNLEMINAKAVAIFCL